MSRVPPLLAIGELRWLLMGDLVTHSQFVHVLLSLFAASKTLIEPDGRLV